MSILKFQGMDGRNCAALEVSSAQALAVPLLLCSNNPIVMQLELWALSLPAHCVWLYKVPFVPNMRGKIMVSGFVRKRNMIHESLIKDP